MVKSAFFAENSGKIRDFFFAKALYYINNSLCEYSTLLLLKTFAEFKKTNTLANCKDREKERGGRALS